jgi:hypothetical protein
MKKIIIILILILSTTIVHATSVPMTFTWTAPTTYTDGSSLPLNQIDYYKLYWGTASGVYSNTISNITGTSYTMSFPDGTNTVYAVATVVTNTNGNQESSYSNQASKTAQYIVTSYANVHSSITPTLPQTVNYGTMLSFTGTPSTGYTETISGCGGSFNGTTLTSTITSACSVTASATINTYSIGGTLSGLVSGSTITFLDNGTDAKSLSNGSFTFTTKIAYGSTYVVTKSADPYGHTCVITNGTGTVALANVTTVSAVCTAITYTFTPVAGTGCHTTPSIPQTITIAANNKGSFTASADSGYTVSSVSGTCGGHLVGLNYTTDIMTGDCSETVNCALLAPAPAGGLMFVGVGVPFNVSGGSGLLIQ